MMLDPVLLSRLQFAFTVSFHIVFPTTSIGLAAFLVLVEYLYLKTGDELYERIYKLDVRGRGTSPDALRVGTVRLASQQAPPSLRKVFIPLSPSHFPPTSYPYVRITA
jgi:hypothetical protein